jgi:hypothetical protein
MPYLPNGTFAESQDEYIARLERENAEARREIVDLQDSLHQALEEARWFENLNSFRGEQR